jgi:hypothetical protein
MVLQGAAGPTKSPISPISYGRHPCCTGGIYARWYASI